MNVMLQNADGVKARLPSHARIATYQSGSVAQLQPASVCRADDRTAVQLQTHACATQVRGVVLLNGAGKFEDEEEYDSPPESTDEVSVTVSGQVAQKVPSLMLRF